MKKFATAFAVLLCLCAAVFAANTLGTDLSLTPKAAAATVVDSGNCGDNVTYTLDSDGLLTISGTGSMYGYYLKSDGGKYVTAAPWGSKKLTQVVISDGVTSIGEDAFYGCTGLTSITIPDSVTSIGNSAFSRCTGLTSITIPSGVTSIGDYAFFYCTGLTSITIPSGVTSIGDRAFFGCTGLTSITIPDGVTSIGEDAFWGCSSLTSITIPDSVTSIGDSAFSGCTGLTRITIGSGVTSIGRFAFYNCRSLTSITIPDSVTSIGDSAFYGCRSLTSITIPSGATSIGDFAFYGCSGLTSITIPNSVTSIGEDAFSGCSGLTKIKAPMAGLSEILSDTGKSKVRQIEITSGTEIPENAFSGAYNLTSIKIPGTIEKIGNNAFTHCTKLKDVYIEDLDKWYSYDFSNIDTNPMQYAENLYLNGELLRVVSISDDNDKITSNTFGNCKSIEKFEIGENNKNYIIDASGALCTPDGTVLVFPYAAKTLRIENGFDFSRLRYMTSLESVSISSDVENIPDGAFKNCVSLREITVDEENESFCAVDGVLYSKTMRRLYVYPACKPGAEFAVPEKVVRFSPYAFANNKYLEKFEIPDSVTILDEYLFYNSRALKEISLCGKIRSIGDYSFAECIALEKINWDANQITSLSSTVFNNAGTDGEGVTVVFGDDVTTVPSNIFSKNNANVKNVYVGAGISYFGINAFCECKTVEKVYITDVEKWLRTSFSNSNSNPLVYAKELYLNGEKLDGIKLEKAGSVQISSYAFYCFDGIEFLDIKANSISINGNAFYKCTALSSVNMSDAEGSIGSYAFFGCSALKDLRIGNGISSIGSSAFKGCGTLESVIVPVSVTVINSEAFADCKNLKNIYILNADCIAADSAENTVYKNAVIHSHAGHNVEAYADLFGFDFNPIHIGVGEYFNSAKCTEPGERYQKCKYCDEWANVSSVPALGHSFIAEKAEDVYLKSAAMCTEKAVYYTSCVRCGLSSMGTENEATFENGETLGHNWGGWKSNEDGTHTRACERDGSHTETADCSASSPIHTDATCTENAYDTYTCEVCGYVWVVIEENSALGHDEISHDAKAATCTEKGNKAYVTCSRCEYTTYEETPALGHDEIHHDAKAATCTEKGNKAYVTCSRCDYTTYEEIPALGHIEEVIPAVAANCVHTGFTEGKKCIRCNEILIKQQEIAKTAHTWDNGTVTREPQVGVAGERTFTCTVCSATRTEEIAPLVPSAPDRIEVKSSDSAKELTGGIVGATHSVTVSELLASSNASYIVDKDGNRIDNSAKTLATGMKIILESGGERLEKVISVLGDVNGDGEISVSDARGALRAAVGLDTLEGVYLNAARVNGADEVAVSDARSILRAAVALDTGKDWLAKIK